jgi:ribonuclease D
LAQADVVAIDTEFMREKTFSAQLCLLQLASDSDSFLIDPLSKADLSSLAEVLFNPRIVKVLHAGGQDLEILFNLLGQPVAPVFDTQVAATLLGLPLQVSLAGLIKHYVGVTLKKSDTYSDWSRRPLRAAQLSYALDDVRYLPAIYRSMVEELDLAGRGDWLDDDFKALSDPHRYIETPERLWQRLKGANSLSRRQLGILQELAIWRDKAARQRDLPRKWVVTDEQLLDITRRNPATSDDLYMTRGLDGRLSRRMVTDILDAVSRGRQLPEESLPERPRKPNHVGDGTAAVDLMQALVHLRSSEQHVASNTLASQGELQALAAGQRHGLDILSGWRREMIGNELLRLLDGSLALSLDAGSLNVTDLGGRQ